MAVDFRALLNKRADTIEKPKPAPVGTYLAVVTGPPKFEEVGEKKTPAAKVPCKLISAGEDVDTDELEAAGGMTKVSERKMDYTFWLTDDAEWRFVEFMTECLGIVGEDRTLGEMVQEMQGQQFLATIEHSAPKKPEDPPLANIRGHAKVE